MRHEKSVQKACKERCKSQMQHESKRSHGVTRREGAAWSMRRAVGLANKRNGRRHKKNARQKRRRDAEEGDGEFGGWPWCREGIDNGSGDEAGGVGEGGKAG